MTEIGVVREGFCMVRDRGAGDGVQLRLLEPDLDAAAYAVFDLETTGLDHRLCQIIEIGWCVVRGEVVSPVRSVLISCPTPLPGVIQSLTGITDSMLRQEGISLDQALQTFFADTHGLPLIGHNVLRFDMLFLEAACRQAGITAPSRPRYRDSAALYKARQLGMRQRPNQDHWSFAFEALDRPAPGVRYSLLVCCKELAIPIEGVTLHRAAGDVHLTQQLYSRLITAGTFA